MPYKRPELAVAAASRAGVKLVVAGDGRARGAVEAAAGPTVEILGRVDDNQMRDLYRTCRALVFPGEEDFGIMPVEAQACGAPVIARAIGGVLDTVVPGTTGVLYPATADTDHVETLARVLRNFADADFEPAAIRAHAEQFAPGSLSRRLRCRARRRDRRDQPAVTATDGAPSRTVIGLLAGPTLGPGDAEVLDSLESRGLVRLDGSRRRTARTGRRRRGRSRPAACECPRSRAVGALDPRNRRPARRRADLRRDALRAVVAGADVIVTASLDAVAALTLTASTRDTVGAGRSSRGSPPNR